MFSSLFPYAFESRHLLFQYTPWILSCGVHPSEPSVVRKSWVCQKRGCWHRSCRPLSVFLGGWPLMDGVVLRDQYLRPGLYLPLSCLLLLKLISPSCAFPERPLSKVSWVTLPQGTRHACILFYCNNWATSKLTGNASSMLCFSSQISQLKSGHSCVTRCNCCSL